MKTEINAIKIGNTVNISFNGKLHKKICKSQEEAKNLYDLILKAKKDSSDENIKNVRAYINEKLRVAFICGLETDINSGNVFMEGFNTPLPKNLIDIIEDYHNNNYPLEPIMNFWKLLMINPDTRVRESLFKFITTHDFVLTDNGYMVVYKAVYRKDENKDNKSNTQFNLDEFISERYLHVKNKWKCNPNKYIVYIDVETNQPSITKKSTFDHWLRNKKLKNIEFVGFLGDLYLNIVKKDNEGNNTKKTIYTDMHTRKMNIEVGVPVKMPRTDCDSDPKIDCSYGLHVGATKYVERFGSSYESMVLVCLVNPANVVAVPNYDHSKMRVSEYFPFAIAKYENRKIDVVEEKYFEDDYSNYEIKDIEKQIKKVKANEVPLKKAIHAKEEERPMSELNKILATRLVDIKGKILKEI